MRRFSIAVLCAASLVMSPVPAQAAPVGVAVGVPVEVDRTGVAGPGVAARAPMESEAAKAAWREAPAVVWPKPETARVTIAQEEAAGLGEQRPMQRAGSLPIRLGRSATVQVTKADKDSGLVFRISGAAGPAPIEVDYSGFRHAFGGGYGGRLTLTRLAEGNGAASAVPAHVPARNDASVGTLSATVSDGLYAVTAGPSSSAGSFRATSLAPSATWEAGLGSGDFTWSYPIAVPHLPGPVPALSLSYNSGGVDGRVGSTNNQPSIVGEGFDLRTGYIERSYQSCSEDGHTGVNDLCYVSPNAVVVLPDLTSELVWDKTATKWAAQRDSGWRIEQLFGSGNGDNDGEYWRLTSPGGVQYYFGSTASAASAWTVPVYGDDANEPCNKATFAASWCQQTYRWSLDRVVDPHGDTMSYFYEAETNHYSRAGTVTPYTRGGSLLRIEYGGGAAQVLFSLAGRCIAGSTCSPAQPLNFPDTPYDQACGNVSCVHSGPTFWSSKRLEKITTRVNGADVDSWTLNHLFPGTGSSASDDSPSLWLDSIVRAGHTAGTITLAPVRFAGGMKQNRIEAIDGRAALNKYRITAIANETGGQTRINYTAVDCATAGSAPAPAANQRRCYPAFWRPNGGGIVLDWFHKYVVTEVIEEDLVAGRAPKTTQYEYVDPGEVLWAHDDSEILPAARQSWGQWRGYQKVRVRVGSEMTEHVFLRGLYDDQKADGGKRLTRVDGFDDLGPYSGLLRQTTVYNGSAMVSSTLSQPKVLATTASRVRTSGTLTANLVNEVSVRTTTALAAGGSRTAEMSYGYDARGRLVHTGDLGDVTTTADDFCTRTSYTENTTTWIINTVSRVETFGSACDAGGATLKDVTYSYNDRADLTGVAEWNGTSHVTVSTTVPDAHGRPTRQQDASGHLTQTAYTPAAGGPVTRTVVTNPLGHTVTTDLHPLRGVPVSVTGANADTTVSAHDALGRVTATWLPGRPTTTTANFRYEYLMRTGGPSAVTTRPLAGAVRVDLFDGLLRPAQTQTDSPRGGRIVTGTVYNTAGRVSQRIDGYWEAGGPQPSMLATPGAPDREVRYTYDAAGRVASEALFSRGTQQWRTTTAYGGDRTFVDEPAGGIDTTAIVDVRGRVSELRQHSATGFDATRYAYTKLGQLATVTDPAGNVRRNTYDLRGRIIAAQAPDTGTSTFGYDAESRLVSKRDARGRTVTYGYDALDRRVTIHEGTAKLAEWVYDTAVAGKGLPASATRYAGGAAYTTAVTGYDARSRRTGVSVTIPAAETGLNGTYTTAFTYREDGQPATTALPGAGGLAAETLTHGYDAFGNPTTLTGGAAYAAATAYDDLGSVSMLASGTEAQGVSRYYWWDAATRRLAFASAYRGDEPVTDRAYDYDAAGNVTSVVEALPGSTDRQCFTYDHLRRLTRAWTPAGECTQPASLAGLGGPATYWHDYTYGTTNNRLGEVRHAPGGDVARAYAYQATQPHLVRSVTTGGVTENYGYDAAGNTISRPGQTLTWDAEGRLSSDGSATFVYDADGNRLVRRDAGGTTVYLGHTEVRRATNGAVSAVRYYEHAGETVATRTPARLAWLVDNHQGTAGIAVADQAVRSVSRRLQLPFGAPRGAAPAWWDGDRGFVDGTADPSGLTHLGAREYDPALGGFVSADPIADTADPQQLHGYGYANANPITFSDADGLLVKKPQPGTPPTPLPGTKTADSTTVCKGNSCSVTAHAALVESECDWSCYGDVYEMDDFSLNAGSRRPSSIRDTEWYVRGTRAALGLPEPVRPVSTYRQAACGGWDGECVTPRPYIWVTEYPDEYYSDAGTTTPARSRPAIRIGGGMDDRIEYDPWYESEPAGSAPVWFGQRSTWYGGPSGKSSGWVFTGPPPNGPNGRPIAHDLISSPGWR